MRGVVVDLADEPIVGAVVDPERPGLLASNPTGRDGRFEVDIIPGEDVVRTPRKPGYVAESRSSDLVIVRPGESVADRTLRMRGTRPLRGWVVDQKGRPIVGATVEIDTLMVHYAAETYDLQQNTRVTKTRTDSAGRFDGFVPLERGARITVTAPTRESRNIDIAGDVEDCRIEIQLDPVLRVRCIDGSTGAVLVPRALTPVAAVRELSSLVGSRARQDIAIDADGAARVPLRTSVGSPARIAAWVDGYLLALSEPIERTADGEAKPDAIVISMQRGGQVEGRVVEFDGSPARAVRIVAKRHPAAANEPPIELGVCGSDGEFRISSLAPGRYEIFGLRGEEATPATSLVEIAASSSPGSLELRFAPSGTIVGLVHDAGVPLPDVRIRSVAVDGRERRIATSDAKGRFVVEGIPAGEIALVIGTANDSDRGAAHFVPWPRHGDSPRTKSHPSHRRFRVGSHHRPAACGFARPAIERGLRRPIRPNETSPLARTSGWISRRRQCREGVADGAVHAAGDLARDVPSHGARYSGRRRRDSRDVRCRREFGSDDGARAADAAMRQSSSWLKFS